MADQLDRQREIRERAGLDESRLNQDFIDFLRNWGTPVLLVLALAAGAYGAYNWYTRQQTDRRNLAFSELSQVSGVASPSPSSLEDVASLYEGVESVAELARLRAADVYMSSVRGGVLAGRLPNPDGTLASLDDALTEDTRKDYLANAERLYERVLAVTSKDEKRTLLSINALFGLASVAESRGDLAAAKSAYERLIAAAERAFPEHAAVAKARIESLDSLATAPTLFERSMLPALPEEQQTLQLPTGEAVPGGAAPLEIAPLDVTPVTTPTTAPATPTTPPAATPTTPPAGPAPATPGSDTPVTPPAEAPATGPASPSTP